MRKYLTAFLVTASLLSNAQTVDEALQTTLTQFYSATDPLAKSVAINRFQLIANKWSTDWATHYYAAYAKTLMGANETEVSKKIAYFDEAEKHVTSAKKLSPENDDIYVLTAMIASMRIGIFPDQWQKYSDVFALNMKKAKEIRKENPRIYYLEGMSKFYTPEAYGGGKKSALPYFQKAVEYFALESDDDIRKPSWGKKQNEEMIKKCEE